VPQKNPSLLHQAPHSKNRKRKPEAAGKVIAGRSSSSLKTPKVISNA